MWRYQRYNEPMGTSVPELPTKNYIANLNLEVLDTCPTCSVSWSALQDSLETSPIGSDDLAQTIAIIENCDVCRVRFKAQMRPGLKKVLASRKLSCFVCPCPISKGWVCYQDGTRSIHRDCLESYKTEERSERANE